MTLCECGCGQEIIIKPHHKYDGIPRYVQSHNRRGKILSEEHKRKLSESHKGKPSHRKGKKSPKTSGNLNPAKRPEVRKRLSEKMKGDLNPSKRPEVKQKMSNAKQGKVNEETNNWQGGISYLPYCPKFNEQKKEEIRDLYGRKCFICKKDEKDNITRLSIHHIDRDKEQGCNGKKWKLVPVCKSCHGTLHNKLRKEVLK